MKKTIHTVIFDPSGMERMTSIFSVDTGAWVKIIPNTLRVRQDSLVEFKVEVGPAESDFTVK